MNTDRDLKVKLADDWLADLNRKEEALKVELSEKHGVPRDAKFEKAWNVAWGLGHSSGLHEVRYYFEELVELIKP